MAVRSSGPPTHALVNYHLERGGMPLHDASYMMRDACVGVIRHDMTAPR